MPDMPIAPFDQIARTALAGLLAFDFAQYLPAGDQVTVRHFGGSYADQDERPAILLRIDNDIVDSRDMSDEFGVNGEVRKELQLSIIVDVEPATDCDHGNPIVDPTRLGYCGSLALLALQALKAYQPLLGLLNDQPIEDGLGPDPDNNSESVRMVQGVNLPYRVKDENRLYLLHAGANA